MPVCGTNGTDHRLGGLLFHLADILIVVPEHRHGEVVPGVYGEFEEYPVDGGDATPHGSRVTRNPASRGW